VSTTVERRKKSVLRRGLDKVVRPYLKEIRRDIRKMSASQPASEPSVAPETVSSPFADEPRPDWAAHEGISIEDLRKLFVNGPVSMDRAGEAALALDGLVDTELDPTSDAYRDYVIASWQRITGRGNYDAKSDEAFDLDRELALAESWPYSTEDPVEVSHYLGAVAKTLEHLGHKPPARVIEFGSGWGHMALTIAATGYQTTAVDLNSDSVALLRRRAAALAVDLEVVEASFLDYTPVEPVDAIVFYEAFHHCDHPFKLLDRCIDSLSPTGRLVFVADAFYENYYAPWGVRPDGHAVIAMANYGWLELGFDLDFFREQLTARGLTTELYVDPALGAHGSILVASRGPIL